MILVKFLLDKGHYISGSQIPPRRATLDARKTRWFSAQLALRSGPESPRSALRSCVPGAALPGPRVFARQERRWTPLCSLRETVSLLASLIFKSTCSKSTAAWVKPYPCNGYDLIAFDIRHTLRVFQSARHTGAFPRETLTAGMKPGSTSYADLRAGIRAFRSANVPALYVGVRR